MSKLNGKKKDPDKAVDRKPEDREAVIARTVSGEEIVSSKAVLNAQGPFGAIDALAPGARLQTLIDSVHNFRVMYPNLPKKATELAVDEVLRLRAVERAKEQELETLRAQLALAKDEEEQRHRLDTERANLRGMLSLVQGRVKILSAGLAKQGLEYFDLRLLNREREDSRWFRLGRWLGFYQ